MCQVKGGIGFEGRVDGVAIQVPTPSGEPMETVVSEDVAREMIAALTEEMHRHRRLRGGSVFEDAEVAPEWGRPDEPTHRETAELRQRIIAVTTAAADIRSQQRMFEQWARNEVSRLSHEVDSLLEKFRRLGEERL